MSAALAADDLQALTLRMDRQRQLLHRQFTTPPEPVAAAADASAAAAMQAREPRSLLMKLLVANPQLLQRLAMFVVTTVVGARLSPWALRLLTLLLHRRRR